MRRDVDLAEGQRSKIALQRAAPPDVERGAVEGTAKCGVVQELAWNRLESPFLHRTHCSRMMAANSEVALLWFFCGLPLFISLAWWRSRRLPEPIKARFTKEVQS
jgi:hypothetical protein